MPHPPEGIAIFVVSILVLMDGDLREIRFLTFRAEGRQRRYVAVADMRLRLGSLLPRIFVPAQRSEVGIQKRSSLLPCRRSLYYGEKENCNDEGTSPISERGEMHRSQTIMHTLQQRHCSF